MIPRIIVATRNRGKAGEFSDLLGGKAEVRTLLDFSEIPEVIEDGDTFEENAKKKALEISARLEGYVLADDSGLEVDALQGKPGVYSARYAGEPKDDQLNNEKLLMDLQSVPDERRGAQFRCVLVLAEKERIVTTVEGVCRGRILTVPRGSDGFGYDPLFVPDGESLTFSEMQLCQKHLYSHRAKAFRELIKNIDFLRVLM